MLGIQLPRRRSSVDTLEHHAGGGALDGATPSASAPSSSSSSLNEEKVREALTTFGLIPFEELEIVREVGSGSFGRVCEARWRGKRLAAKQFDKHRLEEAVGSQGRLSIMQEIKIFTLLSECAHPNIITFLGACSVGNKFCICTEFASYGSLYQFIYHEKVDYSLTTVRRWAIEIASGMDYLVRDDESLQ